MSTTANNRASLLAGLRTGGVRSTSQPSIVPHTAAPGGSFNVPRISSFSSQHIAEDEADELADMVNYNLQMNGGRRAMQPMTASAADGAGNRFQQQQQVALLRQMAAQRAAMNNLPLAAMNGMNSIPSDAQTQAQAQAQASLQMQVMQMEIMKLQALQQAQQVQQYQAEIMAQAQRQQVQQQRTGRRGSAYGEPATAGPMQMSFDFRNSRPVQPESYANDDDAQVPMTAALGGKFGSRSLQTGLNPNANVFTFRGDSSDEPPKTAGLSGRTTVISGGTALGGGATPTASMPPSKSDSALSWRRGSLPSLNNRTPSGSPSVKVTPPLEESASAQPKGRPMPLRFSGGLSTTLEGVAIEHEYEEGDDSDGSYSSDMAQMATVPSDAERDSSPSTPPSAGSSGSMSAREEASKKLYEGLGIGRPVQAAPIIAANVPLKQLSQPVRQPRGPPASVDELGSRNFAARLPVKMTVGVY